MKKVAYLFISLCLIVSVFAVPVTANDYTLEIMRMPYKTEYNVGETLDVTGLYVRITTPDGYINSYNGDRFNIGTVVFDQPGIVTITLRFMDASTSFKVTVSEPEIVITDAIVYRLPNKRVYTVGETLSLNGLHIRYFTEDGFIDSYNGDLFSSTAVVLSQKGVLTLSLPYKGTDVKIKVLVTDTAVSLGDINCDGQVNNVDASSVLKYDSGVVDLNDSGLILGDVNGDGNVDNLDASLILKYDAGVISSF